MQSNEIPESTENWNILPSGQVNFSEILSDLEIIKEKNTSDDENIKLPLPSELEISNDFNNIDNKILNTPYTTQKKVIISPKNYASPSIVEVDDEEIQDFLDKDEKEKYAEIQKELIRNIKFIDTQIREIENKTLSYDKFSKSVFEVKLEFVTERTKILEALGKINKESIEEKKGLDNVKDITDLMGK